MAKTTDPTQRIGQLHRGFINDIITHLEEHGIASGYTTYRPQTEEVIAWPAAVIARKKPGTMGHIPGMNLDIREEGILFRSYGALWGATTDPTVKEAVEQLAPAYVAELQTLAQAEGRELIRPDYKLEADLRHGENVPIERILRS